MNTSHPIRTVNVVRYITPLREGGSMPAIVEADDGFLYVLKFKGAGQGERALIAEIIGGEIARTLGFRVPELVFMNLEEDFGRTEGDEEIQDLLKFSVGLNLGLHYLQGAITFDPVVDQVDEKTASLLVWMDSLLMNVDRTARNTNMLIWHKNLWLIDHGASLYFHHSWDKWEEQAVKPFAQIQNHVLINHAKLLKDADQEAKKLLTPQKIHDIVTLIPDIWFENDRSFEKPEDFKKNYETFLNRRIAHSDIFVKEAENARG